MSLSIGSFDTGLEIPTISNSSTIVTWISIFLIFVLILIIVCVVIWMMLMRKVYNKKIIIFENIAGTGWQNTGRDTARLIKIGDGGEEIMYLRKRKIYRAAYGRKMGINTYWFAIGQDGYWYNVVLGDLDAKMGMLDIEPIDRDMRYMHVAIRKNIQDRYKKQSFMEKYGTVVMNAAFLLIMIIAIWLLISKVGDLINQATATLQAAEPIANKMDAIVGALDHLCGGSGLRAA